jgi:hypothetical protein
VIFTVLFLAPINERNEYRETATDHSHQNLSSHFVTCPRLGRVLVVGQIR